MPRARSIQPDVWQTAAASENGSGCLSFYTLSVLAVFVIITFITVLALHSPAPIAQTSNNAASVVSNSDTAVLINTSTSGLTSISPIFTREVQYWGPEIIKWANAAGIDPNLVAVVMQIESCGDPRALSRAGAKGLFQVMPFHFAFADNPYDPETNALRGLKYLTRSLQAASGDPRLALAGYNGGIGVISRYEWTWSAETKRYIYYGLPIYEDARSGQTASVMLDEWYRKYGAGLCRQASNHLGILP
jgi:soluble lytic murein transglycosylase-like protein